MKHSIATYILGTIIAVTVAMAGINTAFEINDAKNEALNSATTITYGTSTAIAMSYSGYDKETLLNNTEVRDKMAQDMSKLIEISDVMFVYMLVPNSDASTLTYIKIVGDEGTQQTVDEIRQNPRRSASQLTQEILRVATGQSEHEDVEIDNHFGHVLSTYVPVYGEGGQVVGVVGTDISVSSVESALLKWLPGRIAITLFVCAACIFVLFIFLKRRIINPVRTIKKAMDAFGRSSNYSVQKLKLHGGDELAQIASSFNKMAEQINENIKRIMEFKDIQHKQEYELKAASEIQSGFLPPSHFENDSLEVDACMIPAKSIGGDFYDYFEHEGKMIVAVADVSGKGLTGAIFMASTISLLRGFVKQGLAPHEVLNALNRELELNNPNLMFVTTFLCYLNLEDGTIQYSNAGHNKPYVLFNGKLKSLKKASGMPLGVFDSEIYESKTEIFPLGATLLLYTDGVNEAVNEQGQLFGYSNFEACIKSSAAGSVVENVLDGIENFVCDCEQSDDITMLSLTSKAHTLCLPAERCEFAQLKAWVMNAGLVPEALKHKVCLVAEEVFINIASYAYENLQGEVSVSLKVYGTTCILQFVDGGKAFNPSKNIVDIENYDPFAQEGGLGRYVVNKIASMWHYENIGSTNVSMLVIKVGNES